VVALVTLLVTVGAGVALSRVDRGTPTVPAALASMPAETLTASVTDWARVRALLESDRGSGGGAGTDALLDRAYETDASAVSVLGDRVPVMERAYGWSVLDAEWEALAQSRQGAAIIVQMPPEYDLGPVRERLGELGYLEPFDSDGVWRGGADLVAGIDSSLTPLMGHAVVLDDSNRVVFSDRAVYAERTAGVIDGSVDALAQTEAVSAVAGAMRGAVAGVVHAGEQGCAVMGFERASGADRALAQRRVAAVGGVSPYSAVGMALLPGPDGRLSRPPLTVAMHFDDTGPAVEEESQRRAALAVGEAPGQGGTYGSRFAVSSAQQRGGDVVLRLRPREVDAQLLSDLNAGELLFAGC
jgi:hypothetical protein